MKKIVFSIFIALAFSTISIAQLGFRGGVNLAKQSYTNAGTGFELHGKIGYLLGINYKIEIAESFGIRPGFEYALKGTEITVNGADANSNFDYLEIPIDIIYNSGNLSAYAGPYFAFLTSAKAGTIDLKPEYESLDVGLNVGFEINIANIGVGMKYGLGLSNISDFTTGSASIKNNVLSIYAAFTL
jgi:hypothetical protein